MKNEKKPNLFIVGNPKSGTTALYHFLKQHPDIYMSPIKESGYFCKDFHRESDKFHGKKKFYNYRTEKKYLELFDSKKEKIIGEATPSYLYSEVAAGEIYKFNKHAKIIILLRNPIDYIYSLYNHNRRNFAEDARDLETALKLEKERKKSKRVPKYAKLPSILFYFDRIKYANQVRRFLNFFGNNVKIIIYEDFKKDNKKTYNEIVDFLKVSSNFKPNFKLHHQNTTNRLNWLRKLIYHPSLVKVFGSLPPSIHAILSKKFRELTSKPAQKVNLSKTTKENIKKSIINEVRKIDTLLNTDLLKKWNFENKKNNNESIK